MNSRIQQLREETLAAVPSIDMERARIVTEVAQAPEYRRASVPMQRAMVFKGLFEEKALYVGDGELIVGERGPKPAAVPTYPEICVHTEEDLSVLDSREKIPYRVSEDAKEEHLQKIEPFWHGQSQRERMMRELPDEWHACYAAGVFTEFQEQRTPGHTVLGEVIYEKGFLDLKLEIRASIGALDFATDPMAYDKREELRAMDMCADALISYAQRYAEMLDRMAAEAGDPQRSEELAAMAAVCRKVPASAPETFREALQYYWFVHIGVITELNPWDAFNPGRLDQHLWPFYHEEIEKGSLDEEQARELLQAFWVKFHNHPAPPKVGVTAQESGTYTDFALINLGGVKPDGTDATNELTYLILDVIEEMRLLQPSSMVQVSKKNPDRLLKRTGRIVKTGFGQPSIFNTDAVVQELLRQGKSLEDARRGGCSGCVEAGAFGREAYFLSGYFNLPKVLEITLNNGVDPRTGQQLGPQTGEVQAFGSFEDFYAAFEQQVRHFVDIKIRGNNLIESIISRYMPVPFLSLLIDDCIETGRDYHHGGARYNSTYIQGVGLGTVTDGLSSIWHNIYQSQHCSWEEMLEALRDDFSGHEALYEQVMEKTPKYGNDDDRADALTSRIFESFWSAVDGRPNARGGEHRVDMLPTTCHVYFGKVTGALPDGKKNGETVSEGISPVQGADRKGPTAALNSAAKFDHIKTGGTLLNQKLSPQLLASDAGLNHFVDLVRGYFSKDAHHIQFNVVTRKTLLDALENPEKHRDLIVRVAGYSDYFLNLTPELQDEIIRRTEQEGF
ncbi:glycyl radical protein [Verrucomicrobiaceae bacterium N1E253]|uniref:Glycyl radical protein n=1 Tax=Oceaniferula marina TaxID=2748318 RepID=A0A851GG26_9BACT|nr:trans-4-hydroxy-L-proline dehydratase [Oceaniferula marina]NWK56159.1 glycyl radical protein [Oceaniferula marina]